MAGTLPPGIIDPTKQAQYPIILSDALRGKTSTDVFTGIRYNHKPFETPPAPAQLKPAVPGNSGSYDLTYSDDAVKYAYEGTRTTDDDQYVLYFDQARKAFILDRVDSVFHMNLTRTPDETNPEVLARQFEHLDTAAAASSASTSNSAPQSSPGKKSAAPKPRAGEKAGAAASKAKGTQSVGRAKKVEKKKEVKNVKLALPEASPAPEPAKPKPKPKKRESAIEDDEDDESEDDVLKMEFPGSEANAASQNNYSPAFPAMRRFSDLIRESEADDADGESDDDEVVPIKLPSPVNNNSSNSNNQDQREAPEPMEMDLRIELGSDADDGDGDEDEDAGGADIDDLEKELEAEFMQAEDESDVSEEE